MIYEAHATFIDHAAPLDVGPIRAAETDVLMPQQYFSDFLA
jgi:hypothetical protein